MWRCNMYADMNEVKRTLLTQHYVEKKDMYVKRASYHIGEFFSEDVVQEAYAKALRYLDRYPVEYQDFSAFFNVMFNNELKDFRSDRLDKVELMEWHWESGEFDDERVAVAEVTRLERFLAREKPLNRSVIYSALWQGIPLKDIARAHGVSEGAVKQLVFKFRGRVNV
ncbi:MAG: sigma-70 family RNA polymerase sigma factor [Flavobacterium sp.]